MYTMMASLYRAISGYYIRATVVYGVSEIRMNWIFWFLSSPIDSDGARGTDKARKENRKESKTN